MKGSTVLLLCATLAVGLVALALAGEQKKAPVMRYEGQIKSIKIDSCGLKPGTCEGSIVLAKKEGDEVALAIKQGTWLKRGEHFVLLEELGVGNYVHVEAVQIAGEPTPRISVLTSPNGG
jgi:hypothetical protein